MLVAAWPGAAWAQADAGQAAEPARADTAPAAPQGDVIVTARRIPGSIVDQTKPIAVLNEGAIGAIVVTSFKDLIQRLKPLTDPANGVAPAFMLNGRRMAGFTELYSLPPEAIRQVEVLPESEAARLGYPAGTRVTNFITKPRFRAITLQQTAGVPTDGAGSSNEAEVNLTRLAGSRRLTLTATHWRGNPILQTDRDIVPDTVVGNPRADTRAFRSLQPRSDSFNTGAVLASPLGENVTGAIDLAAETASSVALNGLASAQPLTGAPIAPGQDFVLRQSNRRLTLRAGTRLSGTVAGWSWNATGGYDRTRSTTRARQGTVAAAGPAGPDDLAVTTTGTVQTNLTANGTLMRVPAGEALVTMSATYARSASAAPRSGAAVARGNVTRTTRTAVANVDVPITSPAGAVLPFLGQLNLSGTIGVSAVTGSRTLLNSGYGMTWSPRRIVQFTASVDNALTPPDIAQLTDPIVTVPSVPFFDFIAGDSVFVDTITGGRPGLRTQNARRIQLGAAISPFRDRQVRLNVDYTVSRTTDSTIFLGTATPATQAAFPEAFVRDSAGRLISVDLRPLNVARELDRRIRTSMMIQAPLGAAPPPPSADAPADGADAGPAVQRLDRPILLVFGSAGLLLDNRVTLRPGIAPIDLLSGDTITGVGGRPRWDVNVDATFVLGGYLLNLSAAYESGTRVRSTIATSDLSFSGRTTIAARLGIKAQALIKRPWAKSLQLNLSVENLSNARVAVRDRTGATPNRYQRDLLDPVGRVVRLSVRKLL